MKSQIASFEAVMASEDQRTSFTQVVVRTKEAARMLSMSVDSFEKHVRPHIRTIRLGSMVLIPVRELSEFVDANAFRVGSDWR